MNQELIDIVKNVKERISDDSDIVPTLYNSCKELREELDSYITEFQSGNIESLHKLELLFAPTATFQEHSIFNGWSEEYLRLAGRFDYLTEIIHRS